MTCFTTTSAFLAMATSELMPIKAFGIFAALSTLCCFAMNLLILPPLFVIWGDHWEDLPCCICSAFCLPSSKLKAHQETRHAVPALEALLSSRQKIFLGL